MNNGLSSTLSFLYLSHLFLFFACPKKYTTFEIEDSTKSMPAPRQRKRPARFLLADTIIFAIV